MGVCVFTSSRLPVRVDSVTQCPTQQVKYVNRNALSMFKALSKGCKYKCAVLLLNHVEGRLKFLKIQHRIFFVTDNNSTFFLEGIQSCAKKIISH